MPTREDMRNLGQGIISSFEARTAGIASLRDEVKEQRQVTQTQLGELDRNHRAIAHHLQADLIRGRTEIKASVNAQLRGLGHGHAALTAQEGRRKTEVYTWLKGADRAHNAMTRQLRAGLAQGQANLKNNVSAQVQDLDRSHNAMAQRQREDLERGPAGLIRGERLRKSEVKTWLEDVAAIRAGARAAWGDLVATMMAKRADAVAVAEAPPQVAPPPPIVRGVAPAITTEEDAVERVVVGEVTTEFASLTDRVFVYLANHPDGTRLAELEREIGLSRFQAARAVRHLIDEGKTEKRHFCYFAI